MTKKDYVKLARLVQELRGQISQIESEEVKKVCYLLTQILVGKLCLMLKEDNPRFNVDKFKQACQLEE